MERKSILKIDDTMCALIHSSLRLKMCAVNVFSSDVMSTCMCHNFET